MRSRPATSAPSAAARARIGGVDEGRLELGGVLGDLIAILRVRREPGGERRVDAGGSR